MLNNFRRSVYALVLVALVMLGYRVYRLLTQLDTPRTPPSVASLAPTEQEKFMVTQNHVTTIKRGKNGTVVSTEYVPNRAVITLNKDGSVSVKNQRFGLTFQPGLALGYVDAPRVAVEAKVLYFSRLGLNTGISSRLSSSADPRIFIALSYALIGNTSVLLQFDHKKDLGGFLSVRF